MGVKVKFLFVLQVLLVVNVVHSFEPKVDPLVHIEQGLVRGHLADDGMYSKFLGVPFAAVNLNSPFGPSEPHPGFGNEIFDARDDSIACPQPQTGNNLRTQTLDCLRLNIYVPYKASSKNPLPVLVWIHGGEFSSDQGIVFNPKYFMDKGILVVKINYRLGPYGFMCLDSPFVPGNQGLKDQYEALRWVKKNIAAFGGNPYEVTIAGAGAGSSSVLLHLLSSKEKLYKKVIAQSLSPFSYDSFVEGDTNAAFKLAERLGLNTTDTDQALEFLTQTSPELLINAFTNLNLDLKPCKEKSFSGVENFIETNPYYFSNPKKIRNTPVLIGHATNEGGNLMNQFDEDYFKTDPFYEKLNKVFDLKEEHLLEAASIVRHFYIGDEAVSQDVVTELADYESDFLIHHPIQRSINLLLKENADPVYEYVCNYCSASEDNMDDDMIMLERLTTLWANFVKYGNPTPEVTDLLPVTWKPVTERTRPYMWLDMELQMRSRVYMDRMAFWDLFYEQYGSNERLSRKCSIEK